MPLAERTASIVWQGDIQTGGGRIESGSGSFQAPVSFPSRLESESENTSPEELMAAAHASCYAMALANTLHANGHRPERLEVTAVCKLHRTEEGLRIQEMELHASAWDGRMDQETFATLAQKAEERCPVSNALRGQVAIVVNAETRSNEA